MNKKYIQKYTKTSFITLIRLKMQNNDYSQFLKCCKDDECKHSDSQQSHYSKNFQCSEIQNTKHISQINQSIIKLNLKDKDSIKEVQSEINRINYSSENINYQNQHFIPLNSSYIDQNNQSLKRQSTFNNRIYESKYLPYQQSAPKALTQRTFQQIPIHVNFTSGLYTSSYIPKSQICITNPRSTKIKLINPNRGYKNLNQLGNNRPNKNMIPTKNKYNVVNFRNQAKNNEINMHSNNLNNVQYTTVQNPMKAVQVMSPNETVYKPLRNTVGNINYQFVPSNPPINTLQIKNYQNYQNYQPLHQGHSQNIGQNQPYTIQFNCHNSIISNNLIPNNNFPQFNQSAHSLAVNALQTSPIYSMTVRPQLNQPNAKPSNLLQIRPYIKIQQSHQDITSNSKIPFLEPSSTQMPLLQPAKQFIKFQNFDDEQQAPLRKVKKSVHLENKINSDKKSTLIDEEAIKKGFNNSFYQALDKIAQKNKQTISQPIQKMSDSYVNGIDLPLPQVKKEEKQENKQQKNRSISLVTNVVSIVCDSPEKQNRSISIQRQECDSSLQKSKRRRIFDQKYQENRKSQRVDRKQLISKEDPNTLSLMSFGTPSQLKNLQTKQRKDLEFEYQMKTQGCDEITPFQLPSKQLQSKIDENSEKQNNEVSVDIIPPSILKAWKNIEKNKSFFG